MGLRSFLRWFLSGSRQFCPRCGLQLVEWFDSTVQSGYITEMRWRGCPTYLAKGPGYTDHLAYWQAGKRQAEFDPKTGQRNG